MKSQIESICNNTEDFETRLFNVRLEEIRIEIQKVKEERDRVITSYLVRSMSSKKTLDMLEFLEENEKLEDEMVLPAVESMVDKIIVIDNDLPEESINVSIQR